MRLESIERDVSFLRDTISELLVQIRQPQPALAEAAASSAGQLSHQYSHHEQLQSSPLDNNAPVSVSDCVVQYLTIDSIS